MQLLLLFLNTITFPVGSISSGIYDTRGESKGFTNCTGSKCMAWEFIDDPDVPPEERRGYCEAIKNI